LDIRAIYTSVLSLAGIRPPLRLVFDDDHRSPVASTDGVAVTLYVPACLGTPFEIRNTLIHEVGHVLVGVDKGHSAAWETAVRDLGGIPEVTRPSATVQEANGRTRTVDEWI
jgi:hypothetical protein